jgi:hypothetical protein
MFGWMLSKPPEPEVEETNPREEIRHHLATICNDAKLAKEAMSNPFQDGISLVCFVNSDMPMERQISHCIEAVGDYMLFESSKMKTHEWHERSKMTGKKNKVLVYKVPADDMVVIYSDHIRVVKEGKRSPIKSVSAIIHAGNTYPVSFCLGFMWSKDTEKYNYYESFTI